MTGLAALIMACSGNKQQQAPQTDNLPEEETAADSTIYGRCGEGTAMSTLELITDKGDTLRFATAAADTSSVVLGGLLSGDRLAVVAHKSDEALPFAQRVINLTTLLGKWSSIERTFQIEEGGVVESLGQEPKPYVDWKIFNGKLILSADTFDIYQLGPDSLLLENQRGIYAYKRMKK